MTISVTAAGTIGALDGLLAVINGGTGEASGDFSLFTAADALLATLPFSATAFAGATDVAGTIKAAANNITASATPTAGTIAKGQFRNKANAAVISFAISMSGGGGDMIITNTVIPGDATAVTCSGLEVSLALT